MNNLRRTIEQNLSVGLLLLLLCGCLLVLWPFVTALLWASVLSFSLWPLYQRIFKLLRGRATTAAFLISLATILAVLLPFGIVTVKLADNVSELKTAAQRWIETPPAPPAWLEKVPLVGRSTTEQWRALTADTTKLRAQAESWIEPIGTWLLAAGLKLGRGLLQLALSLLITFFLLRNGPSVAGYLTRIIERIAGERGRRLLFLAGTTVRGVVYGILGTALVQAVMAGLGLLIAGVPGAALLAFMTFFLSVVPMGPPLILFPAAFWLFHQGSTGWGVFMMIWAIIVSTVDNFVKPWLISQGSDMPLILILFGVLGGAIAFGFIGVFIGPTLLAVGYRLVTEWSSTADAVTSSSHVESVAPSLTMNETPTKS
ncbi:MAG TPA: AI-2E family transporter [Candidatus Limnocylindrales bacterium]|jgi:predicted PurR-regulated permease PerM|nr:AI-2E family transporter [Candidatus Limnocylindrales bacterium]